MIDLLQLLFYDTQDIILSHNEMFHPIDLDFISSIFT